jgi:hypothetical protein
MLVALLWSCDLTTWQPYEGRYMELWFQGNFIFKNILNSFVLLIFGHVLVLCQINKKKKIHKTNPYFSM